MSGPGSHIPIGVYRGRGCGLAKIREYEQFIGRAVNYVEDFTMEDPANWGQFERAALTPATSADVWAELPGTGRTLALALSCCCCGTSWADEATGRNDTHWRALGTHLIGAGLGGSLLRIGRELNGNWYRWQVTESNRTTYIAGYRHIISVLRGLPGASFRYCWNPILGTGNLNRSGTEACYPGDQWVDEVGLDVYDGDWSGIYGPSTDGITTAQQQRVFDTLLTQWDGLRGWCNLARDHHKPISFPEWGLRLWKDAGVNKGGGDNAVLIAGMAGLITGTNAAWHALWEDPWGAGVTDPDSLAGRPVPAPMARAAFLAAFGS